MSSSSSLSPWDISGLGPGFGLHRSRRPSYTYATQIGGRQRTESYRYALRKSTGDEEEPPDFVESMISKRPRKESYIRATRKNLDSLEMGSIPDNHQADSLNVTANNHVENRKDPIICREKVVEELKAAVANRSKSPKSKNVYRINSEMNPDLQKEIQRDFKNAKPDNTEILNSLDPVDGREMVGTPCSELSSNVPSVVILTFKKNLIFLCISFIMLFSAFRAIQNLQTSINAKNHLGSISMSCVHGTMFLTCLWAPTIINTLSAKWAIVCGMFSLLVWIGANFYPRFYTLIPTAIFSGFGQGILWTAEISYILKLAFDSSRITKDGVDKEVFRFHGIFLACFQTTHIWGNLISSLMLHHWTNGASNKSIQPLDDFTIDQMDIGENGNYTMDMGTNIGYDVEMGVKEPSCGNLYPCIPGISADQTRMPDLIPDLWKLMCAYLVLGFIGFCLIFFCLDKIGARVDPEKTGLEIVQQHLSLLTTHKTFRLLIPLLIFSGLQQGFMFADFNKAYVTCSLGVEYVGYSMIVMGLASVVSAVLVAVCAKHVQREVVFGIGGILHMGLMIGFLIWIPKKNLVIYFFLSAAWGMCDAVWQTQCNTLICITCLEEADIAFANYRMLQSLGLMISFLCETYLCVSAKLYTLMILLVVSIMFYVLAEYRVRQVDNEVFEEPPNT